MKLKLCFVALLATGILPMVLSQEHALFVKRDAIRSGKRTTRQTSADQMVQNILQWLQGVYTQNSRRIRQGSFREYLPPTNTQKPSPFKPSSQDESNFIGYPPAGIFPQPPFHTGGEDVNNPEYQPGPKPFPTGPPPSAPSKPKPFPTAPPTAETTPGYTYPTFKPTYTVPTFKPTYSVPTFKPTYSVPTFPPTFKPTYSVPTFKPTYAPTTPPPTYGTTKYPIYVPSTTYETFPPYTNPPSTYGPVTNPPPTYGPVTNPPPTYGPVTNPPPTYGPVTNPPPTYVPVTNPPPTYGPVTNPPPTYGPVTNPPITYVPVTNPPATYIPSDTFLPTTYKPSYPLNLESTVSPPAEIIQTVKPSTEAPTQPPEEEIVTEIPTEVKTEVPVVPTTEGPASLVDTTIHNTEAPKTVTDNAVTPGDSSAEGSEDSEKHPPHIHAIEVECAKDMMTINIEFNRPFNGIIYSKEYYNNPDCRYVAENSGKTKYSFTVSLNSCGTEFVNAFDTQGQSYLENTLVLQNEAGIQEVWDTIRAVRCLWEGNLNKALSVALSVGMLTQEIVTFSGDTAMAKLDIQLGKGPFAPAANGLVKIGEVMTLVVSVSGDPGFDLQVKDCRAKDSNSENSVALTDNNGCVLKPKLFGSFQKTRETGNSGASIIAYAYFSAFKFPDVMDLMIECNVELCKTDCEVCPDPLKVDPGRRKREVGVYNETLGDPVTLGKTLRVILPEDLSDGEAIINLQERDVVCMSMHGFVICAVLLILLLAVSTLISATLWIKNQKMILRKV